VQAVLLHDQTAGHHEGKELPGHDVGEVGALEGIHAEHLDGVALPGPVGPDGLECHGVRPDEHVYRVRRWRLPMMVVFGHISMPDAHAAQRPAFESFVSRVDIARPG